jgi:hypothetical protein
LLFMGEFRQPVAGRDLDLSPTWQQRPTMRTILPSWLKENRWK